MHAVFEVAASSMAASSMALDDDHPAHISDLDTDALAHIFAHADAYDLASAAAVCTAWRDVCCADHLWESACLSRWRLLPKTGRYKYGERLWREVYRVGHRRLRIPESKLSGIGPREVCYSRGRAHRVCAWLAVEHGPACRLADSSVIQGPFGLVRQLRMLRTRVVVQNLRSRSIVVGGRLLSLHLRDTSGGAVPVCHASSRSSLDARVLEPLGCTSFDISFKMPSHMNFEPDALEAADTLRVRFAPCADDADQQRHDDQEPHHFPLEVACKFEPGLIWQHYEQINASFFCHNEPLADATQHR